MMKARFFRWSVFFPTVLSMFIVSCFAADCPTELNSPQGQVPFGAKACAGDGKVAREIEPRNQGRIGIFDSHEILIRLVQLGEVDNPLKSLAWSPDSRTISAMFHAGPGGQIYLLDAESGAVIKRLSIDRWFHFMRFSPDGTLLLLKIAAYDTEVMIPTGLSVPLPTPSPTPPPLSEKDPPLGFSLVSWQNFGAAGSATWETAVQDLFDHGVRQVSICAIRFFDPASGAIAQTSTMGPELSHIEAAIRKAKMLGMTVLVVPFVEPQNFAFYRGDWNPRPGSDGALRFFRDYREYLTMVGTMAQKNGVDFMMIGTELNAIVRNSGHSSSITSLIESVSAVFAGKLGYAANWDSFADPNLTSVVWENPAIKFVGIDAFFSVATDAEADRSRRYPDQNFISIIERNWNRLLDNDILPFARARQQGRGLPVVITEIGFTAFNRSTVSPYLDNSRMQPVDEDEALNAYQGMRNAFHGRDELLGAFIWHWTMPGTSGSAWSLHPDQREMLGNPAAKLLVGFASGRGQCRQSAGNRGPSVRTQRIFHSRDSTFAIGYGKELRDYSRIGLAV